VNEPLKTATAIVGLLAGVVAGLYVLGGLVIALRMLFDHFSPSLVVTTVGQLPRELVVSTAMLEVLLPALTLGLLAALGVGAFHVIKGLPRRETQKPQLSRAGGAGLVVVSAVLVAPAVANVIAKEGLRTALLTSVLGLIVTAVAALIAWFAFRLALGCRWPFGGKLLVAGALTAAVALTPAVMLAASLDFEDALVCTAQSQVPETGQLIGEGGGWVLLEEEFDGEASVRSLPSDEVTKSEFGDLSSTFTCPAPPGTPPPAVEEAKLGGHGSEEEQRLAMELRPRLRFDSHERWRPIEVESFVAEHALGAPHGSCAAGADPPCGPLQGIDVLGRRKDTPTYIDIHGSARNGADFASPDEGCQGSPPAVDCNSGQPAVVYYRRTSHEGRWYWDYWWFLRYNDYRGHANHCVLVCADHEGDWEGITVITTPSLEPEILGAIYASHKDRVLVEGAILPVAHGHPLVWVAEGTHASYPFRCDESCSQYGPLPEETHDGAIPWGGNRDKECEANECVRPLPEIGKPTDEALPLAGAWAGWPGKWGETCHDGCRKVFRRGRGLLHNEASPRSPGLQGRFQCPWVPTRRARLAKDGVPKGSEKVGDTKRLAARCKAERGGL
jgi:hypothetical protein